MATSSLSTSVETAIMAWDFSDSDIKPPSVYLPHLQSEAYTRMGASDLTQETLPSLSSTPQITSTAAWACSVRPCTLAEPRER